MAKYIIVDAANLFFRCLHGSQGDPFSKAGLSLHIILRSIKKLWRDHKADHVVFCLEGKSWRYQVFPKYKAARKVARNLATPREREEGEIYQQTLNDLIEFLQTKTNVTVLQKDGVEGDDFVGRWVQIHPDDEHLIVSGDSDFIQLLADNVSLYDGVRDIMIKVDGVFNADGQPLQFNVKGGDGKIKVGAELDLLSSDFEVQEDWWRYALFVKCIRGDSGDGIFSAYPRVQEKKLKAAWDDRLDVGYNWNNLMLQEWKDGEDENNKPVMVRVKDKYEFNQLLIDLTRQPDDIKELMDATIIETVQKPRVTGVGIHFLKFCNNNGLVNISREAGDHAEYLNAPYSK
jgi:hypothetical protein